MEVWREELYHGLLDNLRGRVKNVTGTSSGIGRKGNGLGGGKVGNGSGRTWKEHKYIRIENGRYIYPEDLKKKASLVGSKVASSLPKKKTKPAARLSDMHKNNITSKFGPKNSGTTVRVTTKNKAGDKTHTQYLVGGRKVMKNTQKAIDNAAGAKNSTVASERTGQNTYNTAVAYRNGKQWFDTLDVYSQKVPAGNHGEQNDLYVYNYGYFHQAANAGRDFVNRATKRK